MRLVTLIAALLFSTAAYAGEPLTPVQKSDKHVQNGKHVQKGERHVRVRIRWLFRCRRCI